MNGNEIFSISDFAEFTRTTRDTLLYYDKIRLLSPATRGENNYRYYSGEQITLMNFIRTFQALGMSLNEIKDMAVYRTPKLAEETLENQIERIDEKINEWVNAKELLQWFKKTIQSVSDIDENTVMIRHLQAESIVLGDLNDYSQGSDAYDALFSFYHKCKERHPDMDMNFPVWAMFSEERIKNQDWVWPDRYYLVSPKGRDKKNAALYAIGYKRGGYGNSGDLYERIWNYIEANGYMVCGPAYEEYPLNEICVSDEKDYLMRVMITVRSRQG